MSNKKNEILSALRQAGAKGVTNVELSAIALRYGGYLGNLYQDGHEIKTEHEENNIYRYYLINENKEAPVERPSAHDKLLSLVDDKMIVTAKTLEKLLNDNGIVLRYKANYHRK